MGRVISTASWIIFFFFCGITALVFISQNSVPGDRTYRVKVSFEKVLVRASKVMNAEVNVQIELTKRRVKETEKVIASTHASESLTNLSDQVSQTEGSILVLNDAQKQQKAAKEYITALTAAQMSLENEKKEIVQKQISVPEQIVSETTSPTILPTSISTNPSTTLPVTVVLQPTHQAQPTSLPPKPQPTPPPPPPPQTVTAQITQTQEQISGTIEKMKKLTHEDENEEEKKNENKPEKQNKMNEK